MTYRLNLETEITAAERQKLAGLMKQFLTQAVIDLHTHVDHLHRFFTHHRAYIFGLERFIKDHANDPAFVARVVPLPYWDAHTPLPSSFDTFEGASAVAPNAPPPPPTIPAMPVPPAPPTLGLDPIADAKAEKAYAQALIDYKDADKRWTQSVHDALLLDAPVTDTTYLWTGYPGKGFPTATRAALEDPGRFLTACAAPGSPTANDQQDLGFALGMDISQGLLTTATHFHGITHASLAGVDTPYNLVDLAKSLLRIPGYGPFKIGPFLNIRNTAAPFIFWPLHAFFETLYYRWEQAKLLPVTSPDISTNAGNGDNLELFTVGAGGLVWHCCHDGKESIDGKDAPNPDNPRFGNWEHWHQVGEPRQLKRLVAARNRDKQIEVYAISAGAQSSIVRQKMLNWDCEQWTPWEDLGGFNKDLAVARNADGRMEIFAVIEADDSIWHAAETAPGGAFGQWQRLFDGGQSKVTAILDGNTTEPRIHVFSLANGYLWHRWQTAPSGPWSGDTESAVNGFTQQLRDFKVARNQDGRLEVFAIGTDGKVRHCWQTAAGGNNGFTPWVQLDDFASNFVAVGRNPDGRLEAFFGAGPDLFHRWQVAPNQSWSGRERLPLDSPMGTVAQPFTAVDPEGRLMLFVVAGDGLIWHLWQNTPGAGPWVGWLVI